VDKPICSTCTQPQRGIVEFRWSDGAVVYQCAHCGAFNEVSVVPRPVIARSVSFRHHIPLPGQRGNVPRHS